jgi:TatD DNase family protein
MIPYFDSHAHVSLRQFDADRADVMRFVRASGCEGIIELSVDKQTTERMLELFSDEPLMWFGLGLHPHQAAEFTEETLAYYRSILARHDRIAAIGEVGLDNTAKPSIDVQKAVYDRMTFFAAEEAKTLVIHNRGCDADILAPVLAYRPPRVVFHCFASDASMAKRCIDAGAYLSFSGMVTYPSAQAIREAAVYAPLDRILVESDCPYLAPQSVRGKRNVPSYIPETLACLAKLKGLYVDDLARMTVENTRRAFALT